MKGIIGCEESQIVTDAFLKKGHEFYSCDILAPSGPVPLLHIQEDIFRVLAKRRFDFIGLHSPCTYTCVAGNKHYAGSLLRDEGILFTVALWEFACSVSDFVYLEQPKSVLTRYIGKPTQLIHPWQFGHGEKKSTYLWLKGLPLLLPEKIVPGRKEKIFRNFAPGADRGKMRSKTYPGVALAMSNQWNF